MLTSCIRDFRDLTIGAQPAVVVSMNHDLGAISPLSLNGTVVKVSTLSAMAQTSAEKVLNNPSLHDLILTYSTHSELARIVAVSKLFRGNIGKIQRLLKLQIKDKNHMDLSYLRQTFYPFALQATSTFYEQLLRFLPPEDMNLPKLTSCDFSLPCDEHERWGWCRSWFAVNNQEAIAIVKRCINLTDLNLTGFKNTDTITTIIGRCRNLTSLNLRNCLIYRTSLLAIPKHCPNLMAIDLTNCRDINSSDLIEFAQKFPNLTDIDLENSLNDLSDSTITALARYCQNLKSLSLVYNGITDSGLLTIAKYCLNLTSLNLAQCKKITDSGIQAFAQVCPNLTNLNLYNCSSMISETTLIAIAQRCTNLTSLDLGYCANITNETLKTISIYCPKLTYINLSGCHKITDLGLLDFVQNCPNLTHIHLGQCLNITTSILPVIAQHCPKLTSFSFGGGRDITDADLSTIVQHCPQLTDINLNLCRNITSVGLTALLLNCSKLTSVSIFCHNIPKDFLATIRKRYPQLTILD